MKYSVITFGCRVNQADSLGFEEALLTRGATVAAAEEADLVIVNTCSVTASADQGARQTIRRIARQNPGARIVVTGCYATRSAREVSELPNVTQVVPNGGKARLIELLDVSSPQNRAAPLMTTAERFSDGEGSCGAAIEPGVAGRTAFTLRVQTGCAEPCAYCIIPTTRGTPSSRPVLDVVREIRRIAAAGFKEIVLTGVHLGSYGRDLITGDSLLTLLRALATEPLPGDVLFRISSLEPMDCTPEIVSLVAESDRLAPHFHLPLQHASDRVLAAMRRPYTAGRYAALVEDIRDRMPHASIGSDVIVGFPGETDQDFGDLTGYLDASPLTHLHVFPYSDRPGTEASRLRGKVGGSVVRARGRAIREIGARLAARFRDSQVGSVHRALTLEDGSLVVTENYLKVRIPPGRDRNEWVSIRILSHDRGELVDAGSSC